MPRVLQELWRSLWALFFVFRAYGISIIAKRAWSTKIAECFRYSVVSVLGALHKVFLELTDLRELVIRVI